MPKLPEYDEWDATEAARLVRAGEVSPEDLLEAAIERIDTRNGPLNAVVTKLYDYARTRVATLPKDAPFRGVPFLLKDLKLQLKGTVTTNSTRLLRNATATESSVLAKRYEAAGLVVVGKTNTPEFGITGVTESKLRGPCRNPWNTDRTAGGSSGGSAAAVAARMVSSAHGGDGGGSIRIPASCNGLFGLKPTRGRVTMAPFMGEAWSGYVQEHVLTRSVRDSAALLDIADPPTPGEPYAAPAKERSWAEEAATKPGKLKIAFTAETLYASQTAPECRAALEDSVALLEELGHEVVEARPSFPKEELVQAYFATIASGTAYMVNATAKKAGVRPRAADFEDVTWLLGQIGHKLPASSLVEHQINIHKAARKVAAFFEDYDILVTPTLAGPPIRIGETALGGSQKAQLRALRLLPLKGLLDLAVNTMGSDALAPFPNTQLFNQTGQPAMSVPLYWTEAGLPIGTQFAAKFGGEGTLFRLASQLEEARPWANRRPPA